MPKKIDPELKVRAVRMVTEHQIGVRVVDCGVGRGRQEAGGRG